MNLINFRQAAKLSVPGEYDLPTKQDLARIQRGSYVRICINGDYLWALVQSVYPNQINAIADDTTHAVSRGDWISFHKDNISQIL